MKTKHNQPPKTLIEKGFDLDKRINIGIALGGVAVGALIPPLAVPAAVVAGGSVAAIPISDRLRNSYVKHKNKSNNNF